MSLAVATTNTGALFSDSQVRNVPNTRAVVPPSVAPELCEPANALSISSTHRMAGATDSATAMARRTFSSDEPTRLPNMRPMSKRSSGSCHEPRNRLGAQALAAALHAEQQDALRRRQAERARLVGEGHGALVQPVLEHRQAADAGEVLARRVILQQAALADDLLLLGEHLVDVARRSGAGP